MHSFYCGTIPEENNLAELEERDRKHLFKTLRAKPGEKIALMDGLGITAEAVVEEGTILRVLSRRVFTKPASGIHLFISPPRKNKMDDLLKQCAEIGFSSINPIIAERTVSEPDRNSIENRWKTLLIEGCKQSGNPFLPELRMPLPLREAVSFIVSRGMKAYFGSVRETCHEISGGHETAWIVGPEGGFTQEEEKLMKDNSFTAIKIGQWTLRIETAAICGAAVLLSAIKG
ncbi:MAG: hypothetical protein A2017_08450 [Lentisphaerae bacterium GWF2_44_16]|nr:MAG: hypothetical protein A2017_08450 [Lentisphaerae bacterium GWF2_44_16]